MRQIAPKLSEAFGQSVIVDNRPGANSTIATQLGARAQPDGYTFTSVVVNSVIYDLLNPDWCCRLIHVFAPITQNNLSPLVMVVHPGVAANTMQDYLQLAKSKPGALTFASAGPGSITQLLGEWIKAKSGANILDVPYKSVGAEVPDLLGGQIKTAYLAANAIATHVQAGKLRGLAVAHRTRLPIVRDVPTTAEAGLPGVEASAWNGYFAPAGTPQPIIRTLNREMVRALNAPDVREQVAASGAEVAVGTPDDFAAVVRSEMAKWGKIIKDARVPQQ